MLIQMTNSGFKIHNYDCSINPFRTFYITNVKNSKIYFLLYHFMFWFRGVQKGVLSTPMQTPGGGGGSRYTPSYVHLSTSLLHGSNPPPRNTARGGVKVKFTNLGTFSRLLAFGKDSGGRMGGGGV